MKRLYLAIFIVLTLLTSGCENNKGPFEIKMENGIPTLYSGKNPASGILKYSLKDSETNRAYDAFEGEFKNGLSTGKIKYFTSNGIDSLEFDGQMNESGNFKGKIKSYNNFEYQGEVDYEIDVVDSKFDLTKLVDTEYTKKMKISDISDYLITASGKRSGGDTTFRWIDGKAYSNKFINISENLEKRIRSMKNKETYYGLLNDDEKTSIYFSYIFPSKEHVTEYDHVIADFASEINVSSNVESLEYNFMYIHTGSNSEYYGFEARDIIKNNSIENINYKTNGSAFEKNFAFIRFYSSGNEYSIMDDGSIYFVNGSYLGFMREYLILSNILKEVDKLLTENDIKINLLSKVSDDLVIKVWDEKNKEFIEKKFSKEKIQNDTDYVKKFLVEIFPDTEKDLVDLDKKLKENNLGTLESIYERNYIFSPINEIMSIIKDDYRLSGLFEKEERQYSYSALLLTQGGKSFIDADGGFDFYKKSINIKNERNKKENIEVKKEGPVISTAQYLDKFNAYSKIYAKFKALSIEMQSLDENNIKQIENFAEKLEKIHNELQIGYKEILSLKVVDSIKQEYEETRVFSEQMNELIYAILQMLNLQKNKNDPISKILMIKNEKKMQELTDQIQRKLQSVQNAIIRIESKEAK